MHNYLRKYRARAKEAKRERRMMSVSDGINWRAVTRAFPLVLLFALAWVSDKWPSLMVPALVGALGITILAALVAKRRMLHTSSSVSYEKLPCEHQFAYAGVRYCDGKWSLPGSGARQRYYGHVYHCTKCAETKGEPISDGQLHNTYMKLEFDATTGTPDQCGVPQRDR